MASSNEESDSYTSDDSMLAQILNSEDEEDTGVVFSHYVPYQDEPIVEDSDEDEDSIGESDLDGLGVYHLNGNFETAQPDSTWVNGTSSSGTFRFRYLHKNFA